jgi:DNA polymerase sigma
VFFECYKTRTLAEYRNNKDFDFLNVIDQCYRKNWLHTHKYRKTRTTQTQKQTKTPHTNTKTQTYEHKNTHKMRAKQALKYTWLARNFAGAH